MLVLWGNAYAQIIRDGRNKVLAMYPLLPNKITVNRADNGEIYYIYTKNNDDGKGYGQVILRDYEVLHIPGLGFADKIMFENKENIKDLKGEVFSKNIINKALLNKFSAKWQ